MNIKKIIAEFALEAKQEVGEVSVKPGSLKKQSDTHLYWLKSKGFYDKFSRGFIILSQADYDSLMNDGMVKQSIVHLVTEQKPRLVFALIVNKYYLQDPKEAFINCAAEHRANKSILIAENVFIGKNVTIKRGTVIYPNVVINSNTVIGENCVIKENCTISTEGLGYEMFEGEWIKFPQIGSVVIGDNVEMGPHATIRRAALDETIIGSGCKIGAFVNIGHNSIIGDNAIFTCQCVISGSSVIGQNLYMGVQSCTRHGVVLGDNVTVGHGAVITKNFGDGVTLVGNPAEPIDDFKKWQEIRKKLSQESI